MNSKNVLLYLFLIASAITLACCGETKSKKLNIFASIQPQKFFIEKIGGDKVDVSVFVKPGISPENFEPLPSHLVKLSNCELYFTIGLQFENKITYNLSNLNPFLKIINTGENIEHRDIKSFNKIFKKTDSEFGLDKNEKHGLHDPHIWMSPGLVKLQAQEIYKSLCEIDSTNSKYYKDNLDKFDFEIDSVINIINMNLGKISNRNLLVFHPAWGYFCDEFNLKQIPIEIEGKEPGMKDLSYMLKFIKENRLKFILSEKQNNSPALNSIAEELNIKIIKNDPLAENYFQNLIQLSELIRNNN